MALFSPTKRGGADTPISVPDATSTASVAEVRAVYPGIPGYPNTRVSGQFSGIWAVPNIYPNNFETGIYLTNTRIGAGYTWVLN